MKYTVFSWGMYKGRLGDFFPGSSLSFWTPWRRSDGLLGWGRKASFRRGAFWGKFTGTPVFALEDGFLRSLGTPQETKNSLSLLMDDVGIFYDARTPSRLEKLILEASYDEATLERARRGIDLLRRHQLTKYNGPPLKTPQDLGLPDDYVLVIDQTYGDASVEGGLADASSFERMLEDALSQNPDSTAVLKTHPEVISGKKKGYFNPNNLSPQVRARVHVLGETLNPWPLLEGARKVYTVTSQMGFEALLAGKEVHCYGMPFYGGWGLTRDLFPCERRGVPRTKEILFAAFYFDYTRYVDPFTRTPTSFEKTADLLHLWVQKSQRAQEIASVTGGYFFWKSKEIRQFFKAPGRKLLITRHVHQAIAHAQSMGKKVAFWSSKVDETLIQSLAPSQYVRMEDGFIRSVGLGANLVAPQSIVVDGRGIYFDPTRPSDLEVLLNETVLTPEDLERARLLIQTICQKQITKYNASVGESPFSLPATPKRTLLVVGQVEDDASIQLGTTTLRTNLDLLKTVRQENPNALILYKPHPDVLSGHRKGAISQEDTDRLADHVLTQVSLPQALEVVDEVHTMTSLVGFEGLVRGKKVHCYGMPFYAGWGLTHDHTPLKEAQKRRQRLLKLEELIFISLILYPWYVDPLTGLWCSPEVLIDRLSNSVYTNKRYFLEHFRKFWGFLKTKVSQT